MSQPDVVAMQEKNTVLHANEAPRPAKLFQLAAAFLAFLVLSPVHATADGTKHFDIGTQALSSALGEFARQSDRQILFSTEVVDSKRTSGIKGELEPELALRQLLKGTGLTYRVTADNTILVDNPKSGETAQNSLSGNSLLPESKGFWKQLRLAQAEGGGDENPSGSAKAEDENKIEEIIVTAQKRQERLIDVPIAISTIDGDTLDRGTTAGVLGAIERVPGLTINRDSNGGVSTIIIRGVATSTLGNGTSPIAYYLDSTPFALAQIAPIPDTSAYDLDRVEVLKGPQGTLFGSSAMNGVVRILTKDANLDDFEFKTRTSMATTKGGDETYGGDMAVNFPLIAGKLAARAVVGYERAGGWVDYVDNDPSNGMFTTRPNANDDKRTNLRLKINAAPTERLSIGLSGWISRVHSDAPSSSDDNMRRSSPVDEPSYADFDSVGLKAAYDFGPVTISSESAYLKFASLQTLDFAPGGFGLFVARSMADARTYSNETVISSNGEGPWRWTLGGMYRDSKDRFAQPLNGNPTSTDDNTSRSAAIFGELTRVLIEDRLEVTGGLRYFHDDVTLQEVVRTSPNGPAGLIKGETDFEKVTPRVVLNWHPRPQATVYVSYSEGFRSGQFQRTNVIRNAPGAFTLLAKPDTLRNYELGAKGSLFGGLADVETAVYYIDWQDVQQSAGQTINGVTTTVRLNGKSASGVGFEAGVALHPLTGLTLAGSFAYNGVRADADALNSPPGFLKGDALFNSSKYMATGSVDYAFSLGADTGARLSASATYRSKGAVPRTGATGGDDRFISRAEFAVEPSSQWTARLYVDNLTNDYSKDLVNAGILQWSARPRPRTVGLQLEWHL